MNHYLFNEHCDIVQTFAEFDKEAIRQGIVKYLTENPEGMVTHEKDFSKQDAKKYAGCEVLNVYQCNPKTGKPSKVIDKGKTVMYLSLI